MTRLVLALAIAAAIAGAQTSIFHRPGTTPGAPAPTTTLAIPYGGTGATTAEGARLNLGAAPLAHTHVLADIAGLTTWSGSSSITTVGTLTQGSIPWALITGAPPSGGITSLNSQSDASQSFSTGTVCVDFTISSSGGVHTFCLPTADATHRGALSSSDWNAFNAKEPGITGTTSADYWAGDKTFRNFASDALGAVTWATITGKPSSFTPATHAASHASGSTDPITIDGSQVGSGTVAAARLGLMTGDSGSGGAKGAVPAPAAGDAAAGKFFSAGGIWAVPPGSSQWTNGTAGAIYYNGGNVGIGGAPTHRLEVIGPAANGSGNEGLWVDNNGIQFATRRDGGGGGILQLGTPNNHNLALMANGNTRLYIDSTYGHVGIGTTSAPLSPATAGRTYLSVVGPSEAGVLELAGLSTDADNRTAGIIQWTDQNASSTDKRAAVIVGTASGGTAGNRGGKLVFRTKPDNGSAPADRLTIDNAGNVGIGASPSYPLDVAGTVRSSSGGFMFPDGTTQTTAADWTPLDARLVMINEEFFSQILTSGQIGAYGWGTQTTGTGTSAAQLASSSYPNLGTIRVTAGTSTPAQGNGINCFLSTLSSTGFPSLGSNTNWGFIWIFRLPDTTSVRTRFGIASPASFAADMANFIGLRYDTSSGFADTNYQFFVKGNMGNDVTVDTGVAADTNFHTLYVYSTVAGTVRMSLDGGTERTFCASGGGCDGSVTIPTVAVMPWAQVVTDTAAARSIDLDAFLFKARVASAAGANKRN